ncbi:MAG: hypothetical protein IJM30_03270 [Thermoguttaceae bacterium]|nr:hypothetical protein [Thermoguttaceae bacterium]
MKRLFFSLLFCACLLGLILQNGCGKNKFGVVDITGKITVDGQPVEGISVNMSPVDPSANPAQRAAAGVTKADGTVRFVAPGSKVAGVMPGEYVLTFQKEIWLTEDGVDASTLPYDPSKPEPKTHVEDLLPPIYKDRSKSECKVTVTDSSSTFEFDLESNKN